MYPSKETIKQPSLNRKKYQTFKKGVDEKQNLLYLLSTNLFVLSTINIHVQVEYN